MSPPIARERVLPTLNLDGTRRRIRPRLYQGPRLSARQRVAYCLMVLFAALPLIRIGGKPLVLLDVVRREFTLFGRTFLPTDGMLLMLLELTGVEPGRALMVGDTTHDLELAANAGVDAIAVSYGAHPEALLQTRPAVARCSSVAELRGWLGANA